MRFLLIAFAAGALAVLGFAPFNFYPVTLMGLAVLFGLWHVSASTRTGFLTGLSFGLGFFGFGVSWVYISLHDFGGTAVWLAALATLLFCLVLALFPASAGALTVRLGRKGRARLMLMPALWVLLEWTRGWLFTGFPWLAVGYSQVPASPLAAYAPLLGVYGVSFMAAVVSALLAWAWIYRRLKPTLRYGIGGGVLVIATGVGLGTLTWTTPTGTITRVALAQGNIAQEMKWQAEEVAATLALYIRLANESTAQLIILPETALPLFEAELPPDTRAQLQAIGKKNGGDLLAGLPTGSLDGAYYNSVLSFGASPTQAYHKRHLVPFGEYIPLRSMWGWVIQVLHIPLSDFSRGSPKQQPLAAGGQKVALNICYEDAFGEEIIRMLPMASVLANLSNDAWFGDSSALWQHAQMSQMRALESGRMMLRATNSGLTAIINTRGELLAYLPPFTQGVLQGTIQGYTGSTPYVRWGNAPILAISALSLVAGLFASFRRRR